MDGGGVSEELISCPSQGQESVCESAACPVFRELAADPTGSGDAGWKLRHFLVSFVTAKCSVTSSSGLRGTSRCNKKAAGAFERALPLFMNTPNKDDNHPARIPSVFVPLQNSPSSISVSSGGAP